MKIEKYLRYTGMLKEGMYPDIKIPETHETGEIKTPSQTTFYINDSCIVLGDSGFRERGLFVGILIIILSAMVIASFMLGYSLGQESSYWMIPVIFFVFFVLAHPFFLAAWFEISRSFVFPVIFNRDTGKVYFFSDQDGRPRHMPWKECSYAVAYKGRSVTACQYELRGFLMNGYLVEDSFSFGDTILEMREAPKNEVFYLFYYIQAFMENDDDFMEPPELMSWRPSLAESARHTIPRLKTNNKTVNFFSTLFYRCMSVFFSWQILGHYLVCRYGKIPQWSQEIIDECGENVILK